MVEDKVCLPVIPAGAPSRLHVSSRYLGRLSKADQSAAGAGIPLMAAGGGAGVVTVWDLEARKLHTIIRDAHDAPVTKLHFFPGEPRLMSAGAVTSLPRPPSCLPFHAPYSKCLPCT